jgi:two-component system response regulator AlgR
MRVLIVDDEALARERLAALLAEVPGMEIVGQCGDGRDAVLLAESTYAECVLLDIAMPGIDGLEAARHLAQFDNPPAVIFCTAYDDHALAAFEASAVDYVVKPVRLERLVAGLERARRFTGERFRQVDAHLPKPQRRTHICARLRGNLRLVPITDVVYFLAEDKYVIVHHEGGEVLIEESLKTLEQEFDDQFVRIHRNCLVAVERIIGMQRTTDGRMFIDLRGSEAPLEVSRRNLPGLRKLVKSL